MSIPTFSIFKQFRAWCLAPEQLHRWATVDPDAADAVLSQLVGPGWVVELLFRAPPYQVERVRVAPYSTVTRHRHPHVDSYEYYVAGEFDFVVGHRSVHLSPSSPLRHLPMSIPRHTWHGGVTYETGGCFLSIQRWGTTPLTSVAEDWEGPEARVVLSADGTGVGAGKTYA